MLIELLLCCILCTIPGAIQILENPLAFREPTGYLSRDPKLNKAEQGRNKYQAAVKLALDEITAIAWVGKRSFMKGVRLSLLGRSVVFG